MRIESAALTWDYRVAGEGRPLVWIHGFPLSAAIWERQTTIPGVRHILPDLPGFGESPAPGQPVQIEDYARGILAIMDQEGHQTAVVAGLSMGGYIAFALAGLAMERLSALILVDTRETPDTPEARAKRYETIEAVRKDGTGAVVDSMYGKMITPESQKDDPEGAVRVRAIMESATPEGTVAALDAMARRPDSSDLLPRIEVPTLIVVGREDAITPPADAERMRAAIAGAELAILDRAAHLSNFERADEFNRTVSSFIERIQQRR